MLLRFGVFPAFCCFALGALIANMPLFRVFRAFLEGFICLVWVCLSWCFAWIVWLLCACGVRRIKGLLRVCLRFYLSCLHLLLFAPAFISFPAFFACPLVLCLSSLFVGCCCFFFPFGMYAKRKGAIPCVLSRSVVGLFRCP